MPEILYVFQVGIEKSHQFDHSICVALAFITILECQQILDHLLDMPPILTHDQVIARGIVFHILSKSHILTKLQEKGYVTKKSPRMVFHGRLFAGWIYWFFTGLSWSKYHQLLRAQCLLSGSQMSLKWLVYQHFGR